MEEKITSFPEIQIGPAGGVRETSFWSLSASSIISGSIRMIISLGFMVGVGFFLYGLTYYLVNLVKKDKLEKNKKLKKGLKYLVRGVVIVVIILLVWLIMAYVRSLYELHPCTPGKTCP